MQGRKEEEVVVDGDDIDEHHDDDDAVPDGKEVNEGDDEMRFDHDRWNVDEKKRSEWE